jgi:hypothetical protein
MLSGGSLIPMIFIGMGMVEVDQGKDIPKLRLRLPPLIRRLHQLWTHQISIEACK